MDIGEKILTSRIGLKLEYCMPETLLSIVL